MDGYAASGAALLDSGFKRTLPCAPPLAIVADLDVIADAPARMAAWGYGDLSGKIVAGADWILADALGEDPIDRTRRSRSCRTTSRAGSPASSASRARDIDALRGLTDGLLISGFAMQAHGNSRPASGSEHQISHVWEMERLTVAGEPAAHGACVGVATVAMLAMYEWLLAQDIAKATAAPERRCRRRVDAELAAIVCGAVARRQRAQRNERQARANRGERAPAFGALRAAWPALRERLASTLVPPATMARWLAACGAAVASVRSRRSRSPNSLRTIAARDSSAAATRSSTASRTSAGSMPPSAHSSRPTVSLAAHRSRRRPGRRRRRRARDTVRASAPIAARRSARRRAAIAGSATRARRIGHPVARLRAEPRRQRGRARRRSSACRTRATSRRYSSGWSCPCTAISALRAMSLPATNHGACAPSRVPPMPRPCRWPIV